MSALASMTGDRTFGYVIDDDGFAAHLLHGKWTPGLLNGMQSESDLLAVTDQAEADALMSAARMACSELPVRDK